MKPKSRMFFSYTFISIYTWKFYSFSSSDNCCSFSFGYLLFWEAKLLILAFSAKCYFIYFTILWASVVTSATLNITCSILPHCLRFSMKSSIFAGGGVFWRPLFWGIIQIFANNFCCQLRVWHQRWFPHYPVWRPTKTPMILLLTWINNSCWSKIRNEEIFKLCTRYHRLLGP